MIASRPVSLPGTLELMLLCSCSIITWPLVIGVTQRNGVKPTVGMLGAYSPADKSLRRHTLPGWD